MGDLIAAKLFALSELEHSDCKQLKILCATRSGFLASFLQNPELDEQSTAGILNASSKGAKQQHGPHCALSVNSLLFLTLNTLVLEPSVAVDDI